MIFLRLVKEAVESCQENKRIAGTSKDKVLCPVVFLKEQLSGYRRARSLYARQEQPRAVPL